MKTNIFYYFLQLVYRFDVEKEHIFILLVTINLEYAHAPIWRIDSDMFSLI